jgi:hypothetical protein
MPFRTKNVSIPVASYENGTSGSISVTNGKNQSVRQLADNIGCRR